MNVAVKPGRWRVASRVFAATLAGFILANTGSVLLALLLPMPKDEAVITAVLLSFALYTVIIMWIFSVRSLRTVWIGLVTAIALSSTAAWLLQLAQASA